MLVGGEQHVQSRLLFVGEQVGTGVQGSPRSEQGIGLSAAVASSALLDPTTAFVQGVAGEPDDVEGVHDCDGVGKLFG